jgi:hypothetical protein
LNIASPEAKASTLYANVSDFQQYTSWQGVASNHTPYQTSAGTTPIASNNAAINLTQNVNNQAGYLWNTRTFSYDNDFSVTASYFFGTGNPDGADLIVFYMKPIAEWPNDGIAGSSTGGVGAWANGEIRAIFDTYQNAGEMANDHLTVQALKLDGTATTYTYTSSEMGVPLKDSSGNTVTDVENNTTNDYTISWTASTRTFAVYAGSNSNSLIYSTVVTTAQMDATSFSFGWGGFTGGLNNYQSVQNVNYHIGPTVSTASSNTSVVDGTSVTLNASYTSSESSPTTRWEYSVDGGSNWTTTGVTSTSYTFTATRSMTQRKYRFYVQSTAAGATFSRSTTPITLTVNPPTLGFETDTALSLNGTTQYARASDANSLDISDSMTIEAWVYQTANVGASWNMVLNKETSYELGTINGYWWYGLAGAGWSGVNTGIKTTLNTWQHIALTRAAGTNSVKFYLNGALVYTGTADGAGTGQIANSVYSLTISGRDNANNSISSYFAGQIDEVRIFSADRTALQIASDMHTYGPVNSPSLRLYYDFNEGSGSTLYNRAAGALAESDISIYNAPSWSDIKKVDISTISAYTILKFPRSYLTSNGGWKVPTSVTNISALIVAGGGGGGWNSGGGGGGGGFSYLPTTSVSGTVTIKVGAGGVGAMSTDVGSTPTYTPGNGQSSTFISTTVAGGNAGGVFGVSSAGGAAITTATGSSGAGGSGPASGVAAYGGKAGYQNAISGINSIYSAGGGGGGYSSAGGAPGGATDGAQGGATSSPNAPGNGGGSTTSNSGNDASTNTGSGGGASATHVFSGNGGSGVIVLRWITALVPTYTKPANAYLNVGQTETFTTNIIQDSATAVLTRTFKWESTTPAANGTYTLLKQGTGAANAFFSWIPTETRTSGSGYLYRLTVTDSDTAGLFISDSSTAYAVINGALVASGLRTITKTVNIGKSETYTISLGTGPYRISWLGTEPKLLIETATASSIRLKVSDTATIGTYYETITVVDSVSAVLTIPLVIKVVPVPSILWEGALVSKGLVLDYQIGNSQSLLGSNGQATTGLTLRDLSGRQNDATTGGTFSNVACAAPTYSSSNGGALSFGSGKCYYTPYNGDDLRNHYTAEVWFKKTGAFGINSYLVSQRLGSANYTSISIGTMGETDESLRVGFYYNGLMHAANCGYIPTLNEWTHIAGTYDGVTLRTYVNGQLLCANDDSSLIPEASSNSEGIMIGAAPNSGNIFINAQIASVRLYGNQLSDYEIADNYHLSKTRFKDGSNYLVSITKKYGSVSQESFTVVSGTDSNTVTFAIGSRSGIIWDSTTAISRIKLNLQESSTIGTYLETITVTDANGSATLLPLVIDVTVADSLTVTMDTATTTFYNGSRITAYPRPTIKGLVWQDTATSVSRFSSATYSENALAPINADTYTVRGAPPTFTVGSLANYAGIVYQESTATINKINQQPLQIFMYGGTVGTPYLIWLQGGNGTGDVSETLTGVSTLSGCSISNHYLSAVEQKQGFCEVRVVKAGDQNYFAETQTAQMYFMAYIKNQPNSQVASGATVGINGVTSFETSTVLPPAITGLSTLTISRGAGGSFTITGSGFNAGGLTVKFWRNKYVTPSGSSATTITFNVSDIGSSGAASGRIAVTTVNGEVISIDSLTITP